MSDITNNTLILKYGSYEFVPTPLVSQTTEYVVDDIGNRTFDRITYNFTGTLLYTPSGDAGELIILKDELLNALSGVNQELSLRYGPQGQKPSGTYIVSGVFPRIQNVNFTEGIWVHQIPYSFDAVYETNVASGRAFVENASDAWTYTEDENNYVIRVEHNASAKGVNTATSGSNNALQNAKVYVSGLMGLSTIPTHIFVVTSGSNKFQNFRTESLDSIAGTYNLTETFIISSGQYAHNYTIEFNQGEDGVVALGIQGQVAGYGRFDDRYIAALSGWNNNIEPAVKYIASGSYSQLGGSGTLNVDSVRSKTLTKNPFLGTIDYSLTYSDNPQESLASGIAELTLEKQERQPIELAASFAIPQRAVGNIIQYIGTPTEGEITLSISVRGTPASQLAYVKSVAEDEINAARPNPASYNTIRFGEFSTTENEDERSFSATIAWIYTNNLASVQSPSGDISFS